MPYYLRLLCRSSYFRLNAANRCAHGSRSPSDCRVKQHHYDQDDRVDQHTVIVQASKHLRKQGQDNRRDHGTADISDAAQNYKYQDHNGHIITKVLRSRCQRGQVVCIQNACHTGQELRKW